MENARVLIVEDETLLAEFLNDYLSSKGYSTTRAETGPQALEYVAREHFEVVLLDIRIPGMDGLEVCRNIRKQKPDLSVIFLSGLASDLDRIRGLDLGGDDYIPKPFNEMEVEARIRAVLRRKARPAAQIKEMGGIRMDPARKEIFLNGTPVKLTPKEFTLLSYLMSRPGEVISRDELLRSVWGMEEDIPTRTVDLHILKLRKKLEPDPVRPRYFFTVHGFGYKFEI